MLTSQESGKFDYLATQVTFIVQSDIWAQIYALEIGFAFEFEFVSLNLSLLLLSTTTTTTEVN